MFCLGVRSSSINSFGKEETCHGHERKTAWCSGHGGRKFHGLFRAFILRGAVAVSLGSIISAGRVILSSFSSFWHGYGLIET